MCYGDRHVQEDGGGPHHEGQGSHLGRGNDQAEESHGVGKESE